MKSIFVAVSALNQYSDVLRSEWICQAVQKYKIVVLSPDLTDESARQFDYFLHPNIEYRQARVYNPRVWATFDEYIRLPFIREYDDLLVTRAYHYRPTHPFRTRVLIRIGGVFPQRFPSARFLTQVEKLFARPSPEIKALIHTYRPSLLVTATPGYSPLEAEMIVTAKKIKIPSLAIAVNMDHGYGKGKFLRPTDYLAAWSTGMKKEMVRYQHFLPENIAITGCLRFDHYVNDRKNGLARSRAEFLKSKNLDPAKKLVVYATSTPISYPPRKEFMRDFILLKQKGELMGDPNILVRLHPHDVWAPYEEFTRVPNVHIERAGETRMSDQSMKGPKVEMSAEDLRNFTETLMHADVLINYSSTTTLDAALFYKPSIGIGFPHAQGVAYEGNQNKFFINEGALEVAWSMKELRALVNKNLTQTPANPKKFTHVIEEYGHIQDGCAWKRVMEFIESIIEMPISS